MWECWLLKVPESWTQTQDSCLSSVQLQCIPLSVSNLSLNSILQQVFNQKWISLNNMLLFLIMFQKCSEWCSISWQTAQQLHAPWFRVNAIHSWDGFPRQHEVEDNAEVNKNFCNITEDLNCRTLRSSLSCPFQALFPPDLDGLCETPLFPWLQGCVMNCFWQVVSKTVVNFTYY